jgi:hypothetical protein
MGYRVLNSVDTMRGRYSARKGLEGPFNFSGRVLYYDPKAGQYYDPTTDFYIDRTEKDMINIEFYARFKKENV